MSNITYLAPTSISSISTEDIEFKYPEPKNIFLIKIISGGVSTAGYGGFCEKVYCLSFDFSKEGFKIKEKTDAIVKKLLEIIKHPLTSDSIVKLTLIEGSYGNYKIEFI